MGNSCNKVTPIVCTARITCTVPIGCGCSEQPAVIEPTPKEQAPPAAQPAFQEAPPPAPAAAPAPVPAPPSVPPATSPPVSPNGDFKPAPILDPVEPFHSTEQLSPSVPQRAESVVAAAADDTPTTSSIPASMPKGACDPEPVEITNVEPVEEQEEPKPKATEEPVDVDDDADLKETAGYGADAKGKDEETADVKEPADADDAGARGAADGDEDAASENAAAPESPSREQTSPDKPPADEEAGFSHDLQVVAREASVSEDDDDSSADLEPFTFEPDALVALERFQLRDKAEILGSRLSGHAAVQALQSMCIVALDAGAATHNCQLLLTQVRIIMLVLARAQQDGSHRVVQSLLEQLHPILMSAEAVIGDWSHKGTVEQFTSGRAADDEFLEVHLQLKDFAQTPAFMQLFSSLPPDEVEQLSELHAAQQLSGYCSIEASRTAFERLLLLFILRYKPTKSRTQKQRLLDLLAEYADPHSPSSTACGGVSSSVEDKIEHLAVARLGRAATHAVPLMVVLMTNMWGVSAGEVPRERTDKWRMAVRRALEPLRNTTGVWQLPAVPEEGVQRWEEEDA